MIKLFYGFLFPLCSFSSFKGKLLNEAALHHGTFAHVNAFGIFLTTFNDLKFHAAVMCGYKKKNDIRYVCSITITEVYSTQCDSLAGVS